MPLFLFKLLNKRVNKNMTLVLTIQNNKIRYLLENPNNMDNQQETLPQAVVLC